MHLNYDILFWFNEEIIIDVLLNNNLVVSLITSFLVWISL